MLVELSRVLAVGLYLDTRGAVGPRRTLGFAAESDVVNINTAAMVLA